MAKPKKEPEAVADVVLPADAGAACYRDNAGKKLGGGPSEGAVNFAAVTESARAQVAELKAAE